MSRLILAALLIVPLGAAAADAGAGDVLDHATLTADELAIDTPSARMAAGFQLADGRPPLPDRLAVHVKGQYSDARLVLGGELASEMRGGSLAGINGHADIADEFADANGATVHHQIDKLSLILAVGRNANNGDALAATEVRFRASENAVVVRAGQAGALGILGATASTVPAPDVRIDFGVSVSHAPARPPHAKGALKLSLLDAFGRGDRVGISVRHRATEGTGFAFHHDATLALGSLEISAIAAPQQQRFDLAASWHLVF